MMRCWIALALLDVSWLFGSNFCGPASPWAWIAVVGCGTALLAGIPLRLPSRRDSLVAAALLLPAVWFLPWPHRAAPLLLVGGLVAAAASIPRRWPVPLAQGSIAAGLVLLVQSLAVEAYALLTARGHDLPSPLATFVGAVARLFTAVQKHMLEEAVAELKKAVQLSGGSPTCMANLARAYVASGERSEAERLLQDLLNRSPPGHADHAELAAVYASLGDADQAMSWLEKGFQERFNPSVLLRPGFDPLRSNRRFKALLRRIGLPR